MKKIICTSIIIVLAAILILIFLHNGAQKHKSYIEDVDNLNAELHAIANQQQELKNELTSLRIKMNTEISPVGTLSIVFTVLDSFVYEDAYPMLEQNNFTAVLGLSPDSLPGLEGCISRPEFNELLNNGWSTSLVYDGETPLPQYLDFMKRLLSQYNIDMPSSIYFPRNTYTSDLNDTLSEYDIEIIIHHGEEELPLITTDPGSDFFYLGSIGWRSVNAPSRLKNTISLFGSVAFIAGSPLEAEVYSTELFSSMISTLSDYILSETLLVTDLDGALEYRLSVKESEELSSEAYENAAEDISRRIDKLEEKRRTLVEAHMQNLEGNE